VTHATQLAQPGLQVRPERPSPHMATQALSLVWIAAGKHGETPLLFSDPPSP
jgi:hypothetical protein